MLTELTEIVLIASQWFYFLVQQYPVERNLKVKAIFVTDMILKK